MEGEVALPGNLTSECNVFLPGAWPVTSRLMSWVAVAVNLCVCDKSSLSQRDFAGALGPTAGACFLLLNQLRYLKLNLLLKILWCWDGEVMPVTDVLVQLPFRICRQCSAFASQLPVIWIPTVLQALQSLGAQSGSVLVRPPFPYRLPGQ